MTKDENKAKKAEEKEKELAREFSEYTNQNKTMKQLKKDIEKRHEKVESSFNKIIKILTNAQKPNNERLLLKLIGKTMKLAKGNRIHVASDEHLRNSMILMQDTVNTLSTRVDNVDENIKAPSSSYHFYRDRNPAEVKLIHNPIMQLLARIKVLRNFQYVDTLKRVS